MTAAGASAQTVLRVDDNSTAVSPDGLSWGNAYASLEDALAAVSDPATTEIWLAEGLYRPGVRFVSGTTTVLQTDTFTVPSGLPIYGGFAGTEGSIDTRTGSAALTVLSGDLQRDGIDPNNAYHVVTVTAGSDEVRLDRLTIRDGEADGSPGGGDVSGGGILCDGSDLYLSEVRVIENSASAGGGGVYFEGSTHSQEGDGFRALRCEFNLNDAGSLGGAIHFEAIGIPTFSSPGILQDEPSWLFNCEFFRNLAGSEFDASGVGGGAVNIEDRIDRTALQNQLNPLPADPEFTDPSPTEQSWTMEFANCEFRGNITNGLGSSMRIVPGASAGRGRIILRASTYAGDTVPSELAVAAGSATIYITGEETPLGGGIPNLVSTPIMFSSIVLAPNATPGALSSLNAIDGPGTTIHDRYRPFDPRRFCAGASNIQQAGGANIHPVLPAGNINVDPLFVNYGIGNFRLQSTSPCVDTGAGGPTSGLIPLDYPDLDLNPATQRLPLDLDEATRVIDSGGGLTIDMGAYEEQGT